MRSIDFDAQNHIPSSEFEKLKGLNAVTSLYLQFNKINDLSILKDYKLLQRLNLGNINSGELTDFSDINNILGLNYLLLSGNDLANSDIDLSLLTNLRTLILSNSNFNDLDSLSNLVSLRHLFLYQLSLTDISPLSGLRNLISFSVQNCDVETGVNDLYMPLLEYLGLQQNNIVEVNKITASFPNITHMFLTNNPLISISGWDNHQKLEKISLEYTVLTELGQISNMPKLENIYINYSQLSKIEPLTNLPSLKSITISNSHLDTLPSFVNVPQLSGITLENNNISEIPPLTNMPNLSFINLRSNKIEGASIEVSLPNLKYLFLNDNLLENIDWVKDFSPSIYLGIPHNFITDASELYDLDTPEINLINNHIPCEQINKLRETKEVHHDCPVVP